MLDLTKTNLTAFDSPAFDPVQPDNSVFRVESATQSNGEKFIIFCAGEHFFAVSSARVAEVAQMLAVTPLPNVPEWLLGIADLRGEIISVIGLQKILGATNSILSTKTKFIVLRSSNFASPIAVTVDKLCEIAVLSNQEVQTLNGNETPFLFGETVYQSKTLNLINVENLFTFLTI